MIFAYPCDYFAKQRPHEFYAYEHALAIGEGFDTMLIDDEKMTITRHPYKKEGKGRVVVWRGWQMSEEKYRQFHNMLVSRDYEPVTNPYIYMTAHSAERYFDYIPPKHSIGGFTLPYPDCLDVNLIRENAEQITTTPDDHRLFVKDYFKSVLNHNVVNLDDDDVTIRKELETIVEKRGKDFAGGLAFKDYRENLEDEIRFILLNEKVVASGPHGDGPHPKLHEPSLELPLLVNPPSLFYMVDVAWSPDVEEWMVIEVDDGQVCELPEGTKEEFYASFRWKEIEEKVTARREAKMKEKEKREGSRIPKMPFLNE